MNKVLNVLKITLEVFLVLVFIFFEEIIWEGIALPIKNLLASLKILESVQAKIEAFDVYPTLAIFLVPLAVAEYMGIKSGVLILQGYLISGVILYALKVPVAGLTFWVFSFSKDKLLSIDWFETLYGLLMRLLDWIKATRIYRRVRVSIRNVKRYIKGFGSGNFKGQMKVTYDRIKTIFKEDR